MEFDDAQTATLALSLNLANVRGYVIEISFAKPKTGNEGNFPTSSPFLAPLLSSSPPPSHLLHSFFYSHTLSFCRTNKTKQPQHDSLQQPSNDGIQQLCCCWQLWSSCRLRHRLRKLLRQPSSLPVIKLQRIHTRIMDSVEERKREECWHHTPLRLGWKYIFYVIYIFL